MTDTTDTQQPTPQPIESTKPALSLIAGALPDSPATAAAKRKAIRRDEDGRIILASADAEMAVYTLFTSLSVGQKDALAGDTTPVGEAAYAAYDAIVTRLKSENPRLAKEPRGEYLDRIDGLVGDVADVVGGFLVKGLSTDEAVRLGFVAVAMFDENFVTVDDDNA